ncbi:hypothetical protein MBM_01904 [Drepanopeziza brunnea f. sp. 'multigermtubi' MB_m1]|uniref:Uncharacterized protein n=1 Tax=Marssonina brunnea f. sp. multigermtubi (strain MB_m1) TaxID=1072389 RepID=K1X4F7_MARBU|nr:uncharacterized protein MBM_01904 [Drepanopeziza brunnea f. sp. 'multigermtubi' MB_m1]EKD19952.1 hypothetical protein MBM_01904 [Drepanopeziza brunnea f. sp. 'multigermtubi' MB_m1]
MAFKAINDTASLGGIILTLLVYGVYLRLFKTDSLAMFIIKRRKAFRAATKEIRRLQAKRKVKDALVMRNRPNTLETLNLLLQLNVKVYKELTRQLTTLATKIKSRSRKLKSSLTVRYSPRHFFASIKEFKDFNEQFLNHESDIIIVFFTYKKKANIALFTKLKNEKVIITLGEQFVESRL